MTQLASMGGDISADNPASGSVDASVEQVLDTGAGQHISALSRW